LEYLDIPIMGRFTLGGWRADMSLQELPSERRERAAGAERG